MKNKIWTLDDLPSWEECNLLVKNEEYRHKNGINLEGCHVTDREPNELERFILEEEPSDEIKAKYFRERLLKLLNWVSEQVSDDRNT